jgi:hypothetical protein
MLSPYRSAVRASPEMVGRVRRRLVVLQRLGMSERAIAAQAAVSPSMVHRVRNGDIKAVSRNVAEALLRVRPGRR